MAIIRVHTLPHRIFTLVIAALGLLVLTFLLLSGNAEGGTITVEEDGSGNYTYLRPALENATDGDTILVGPGNYSGSVEINSSVTLKSREGYEKTFLFPEYYEENGTYRIAGNSSKKKLIHIKASNVTIEGFTFSALPTNIELNNTTASKYLCHINYIYSDKKNGLTVRENGFVFHPNSSLYERIVQSIIYYPMNSYIVGISANIIGGIISRIVVENNTAEQIDNFLILGDVNEAMVINNTLYGFKSLSVNFRSYAIEIGFNADSIIEGNHISNYYFGISTLSYNYRLDIKNNTFYNNKLDILIGGNFIYSSIIENTFISSFPVDFTNIAFSVPNSNSFRIENNTFRNRSMAKIGGAYNFTFKNNTLSNTSLEMDVVSDVDAEYNIIDEKELVILVDESDRTYSLPNAGRIFVIESEDLILENIDIEDASIGVKIINSREIKVQNSTFTNSSTAGVYIIDSRGCVVTSSDFILGNYGVYIRSSDGCFVTNSNFSNTSIGIQLKESKLSSITDSHFSGGEKGIYLNYAYLANVARCEFSGMDIGVYSRLTKRSYLSSNTFSNVITCSIQLFSGENISIKMNTITGGFTGVEFLSSPDGVVEGNTITDFKGFGITLNNTSEETLVSGNRITGAGNKGYGLYIYFSNDNNITENFISSNCYGIFLENSTKNTFMDNNIIMNVHGIYLVSTVFGANFENNSISKNTRGANADKAMGVVDMSWNYWGAETGPYHPNNNSQSNGDSVSDNIDYLPFQRFPGETRKEQTSGDGEEKFIWELTKSQFLILVIDLIIVLGVTGLNIGGLLRNRRKEDRGIGEGKAKG